MKELLERYESRKTGIKSRLEDFKKVFSEDDRRVFAELAFCLCTPQSKATLCWKSIESLSKNGLLYYGSKEQIKPFMNAVRFNENKSGYIVEARNMFSDESGLKIKEKLSSFQTQEVAREWLVENVKGLGMKEASHFLRNVGLGFDLAILDVHIIKNLHKYGVISEIPKSLTKKTYLDIERRMKEFSQKTGVPFPDMDLLFWSEETGMIFK